MTGYRSSCAWILAALVLPCLPVNAIGQQPGAGPAVTGEIERRIDETIPGREGRRDTDEKTPETLPVPEGLPDLVEPDLVKPEAAEPEFLFTLAAVSISGATVFELAELAPLYEEFLATRLNAVQAGEIARRITQKYIDAGFILSRAIVPSQQVVTGVLQLRVIEGYVDEVKISGVEARRYMLDSFTKNVVAARPLNLSVLERAILLISDSAGMSVERSQFDDGDANGAYVLSLDLSHQPISGGFYTDNRGTPSVGRSILLAGAGLNQVLGIGERFQITGSTVPTEPEELAYGEFRYTQSIGGNGLQATAAVSYSKVDGGSDHAVNDIESDTFRTTVQVAFPVVRSRLANFWLNGIFDYRDDNEDQFGLTSYQDHLRVARLRANLTLRDDWNGSSWIIGTISRGLDLFGASATGSPNLSRSDGVPDFTKFLLDIGRVQDIGKRYAIEIAAMGQKSSDPLLSSEELGLGGSRFGRAYDFSEITGEDGVAGSIEIRRLFETEEPFIEDLQVYGFYDIGAVWNRNAFSAEFSRQSQASAGVGLRATIEGWAQLNLEITKPLTRPVYTSNNDNNARAFFSLSANF